MYRLVVTRDDLSAPALSLHALRPHGYLELLTTELWNELLRHLHPLPPIRVGNDHVWYLFREVGVTAYFDCLGSAPQPPMSFDPKHRSYYIVYSRNAGKSVWIWRRRRRIVLLQDVVEEVQALGLSQCYVLVDEHHAYKVVFEYTLLLQSPLGDHESDRVFSREVVEYELAPPWWEDRCSIM